MWFAVLVVSLCGVSLAGSPRPGLQIAFTSKTLDYINKVGIPLLESELHSLHLPDLSGRASVIVGRVHYSLKNIHLGAISIPHSSLTSSPEAGITLTALGISFKANADWSYKYHFVKDHGRVDLSGSEISLRVGIVVGVDGQNHPTLSSTDCSFNVNKLKVRFHGGAGWLLNLFNDKIAHKAKKELNTKVCSAAVNAIKGAGNKALESLPVSVKIDRVSQMNYALVGPPVFTASYIQIDHKGEFESLVSPEEVPFSPSPLPSPSSVIDGNSSPRMLYVWLSDYVANTASLVYTKVGLLTYNITDKMVPDNRYFHLNTKSFSTFVPPLQEKYPNQDLILMVYAAEPPTVKIKPEGANFTLSAHVDFLFDSTTDSTSLAFTLGVLADVVISPLLVSAQGKDHLTVKATNFVAQLSLLQSNIGNFDVYRLQTVVDFLCQNVLLPDFNEYGSKGLPLPVVDGLSLIEPTITLGEGYAVIASDFVYNTSPFAHGSQYTHVI